MKFFETSESKTIPGYLNTTLLLLVWTIIIMSSLIWNLIHEHQHTKSLARKEAEIHFKKDKAIRLWATSHGGVYVTPTEKTPPNPYLNHLKDRDVVTTSGKQLTLMNPAYMLRQIMEDYAKLYGVRGHITSLKPLNPDNKPDEWEIEALKAFEQGAEEASRLAEIDGKSYFRLMRPLIAEEGCLKCHGHQGYKVGDVRGGVSVTIPMSSYLSFEQESVKIVALSHGFIWFFGLLILGFITSKSKSYLLERDLARIHLKEKKESEAKIKESEHLLSISQKIAHLGHWVQDNEGNVNWSDETYRIFGFEPQQFEVTFEKFLEYIHPDDRNLHIKQLDIIRSTNIHSYKLNYRIIRQDGAKRILFEQAEIERDDAGKMLRIMGILQDITKPKEMEESLRESEEKYRSVSETANDAIVAADKKGNVISWNNGAIRLFGYEINEIIGKPLTILMPERFKKAHEKGIAEFKSEKESNIIGKRVELTGLKKDGSEFPLELSISTWKRRDKIFFSGIIHDITERKKREEELHKSNDYLKETMSKLKETHSLMIRQEKLASIGTLSAGVAHEILNPLNIIGTIVQVMQMEKLPDDVKENMKEIMTQIQRATKITNNLRMFAHKKKTEITEVNLHDLFDQTAALVEHDINLENIQINRIYDKNLPFIEADEDELAQIFLNLLNNARDILKGRKNNLITVTTKAIGDNVEFIFSDNGPGMSHEIINKIFDPFFTTKEPGHGTGLGLSITYSIIEKHGGTIRVESKEGEGATFIITLPVKQEEQ